MKWACVLFIDSICCHPSHINGKKSIDTGAGELSCKLTLVTHSLTDERLKKKKKIMDGYAINESWDIRLYLHADSLPMLTVWANINMRSHEKTGSIYTILDKHFSTVCRELPQPTSVYTWIIMKCDPSDIILVQK